MSRLLYVPIVGTLVLMLGLWKQPSEIVGDVSSYCDLLSLTSDDVRDCSSGHFAAMIARATHGTLGGERSARHRACTNFSPRP